MIIGSVGQWVGGRLVGGSVSKWLVGRWSVDLIIPPVGRDSLEVKKDYQGQILVNYSCHGWTFL